MAGIFDGILVPASELVSLIAHGVFFSAALELVLVVIFELLALLPPLAL